MTKVATILTPENETVAIHIELNADGKYETILSNGEDSELAPADSYEEALQDVIDSWSAGWNLDLTDAEPDPVYRLVSVYNQGDEEWKDFSDLDEALNAMAIADQYISPLERNQGNRVYVGLVDGDDFTETWNMADKFRRDVTLTVGMNIKIARTAAGLSQKQLADKIGTAQRQITRYETGEQDLTLTRLREIEIALDLTTGELLENL